MLRLSARWVVPVAAAPISFGAVLVGADGRVIACGPEAAVPVPEGIPCQRYDAAALTPGLVNAHTHLELTGLDPGCDPGDFPTWIRTIRRLKEERSSDEYLRASRQGLEDCWRAGVTTVADTGDSGAVIRALAEMGGRGVVYQEVFGPHPDQAPASMALLERAVERLSSWTSERVRLGVSPHAPYTVSGPLYRAVAGLAARFDLPVAVHLAESPAESELISRGAGPFAEAWRARGIPLPTDVRHLDRPLPIRTPVRWLDAFGILGPDTLCIHLVQATAGDIGLLASREAAVVLCPRSNAAHRHGEAPLAEALAAGLRVAVGTDSAASVGPPDLLAEARAARTLGQLSAAEAFRLVTLDAALAIGLTDAGLISPGAWADLVIFRTPPGAADVMEGVLAAGPDDALATWIAGREVFRA